MSLDLFNTTRSYPLLTKKTSMKRGQLALCEDDPNKKRHCPVVVNYMEKLEDPYGLAGKPVVMEPKEDNSHLSPLLRQVPYVFVYSSSKSSSTLASVTMVCCLLRCLLRRVLTSFFFSFFFFLSFYVAL